MMHSKKFQKVAIFIHIQSRKDEIFHKNATYDIFYYNFAIFFERKMSSLRKEIFRITPERKKEYAELQKKLRKESTVHLEKNAVQLKSITTLENKVKRIEGIIRVFETKFAHIDEYIAGLISDNEEQQHEITRLQKKM